MGPEPQIAEITKLFEEIAEAHHHAFEATDGADPEWPIWYADHLHTGLKPLLATDLTKSRLVHCLVQVDDEHSARDPRAPWAAYYANHFAERFGVADAGRPGELALYEFRGCPFCAMVRRTIDKLAIDVEMRDIHRNDKHWSDLVEARGRATVPVLKITEPDGSERWMPESADIVRYLESTFGEQAA